MRHSERSPQEIAVRATKPFGRHHSGGPHPFCFAEQPLTHQRNAAIIQRNQPCARQQAR